MCSASNVSPPCVPPALLARRPLKDVAGIVHLTCASIKDWGPANRGTYVAQQQQLMDSYAASKDNRQPLQHFYRMEWVRAEGLFRDPPADLQLGTKLPVCCCHPSSPLCCPCPPCRRCWLCCPPPLLEATVSG